MNIASESLKLMGIFAASTLGGSAADRVVDSATHIPIGVAISVTLTAVGIAAYLSRVFQKLQDSVDELKTLDTENSLEVEKAMKKIDALPCHKLLCEEERNYATQERQKPEND